MHLNIYKVDCKHLNMSFFPDHKKTKTGQNPAIKRTQYIGRIIFKKKLSIYGKGKVRHL